jgi:hypothetical protein
VTGAWRADFRRLWLGAAVSNLGSQVTGLALPLTAAVTLGAGAAPAPQRGSAARPVGFPAMVNQADGARARRQTVTGRRSPHAVLLAVLVVAVLVFGVATLTVLRPGDGRGGEDPQAAAGTPVPTEVLAPTPTRSPTAAPTTTAAPSSTRPATAAPAAAVTSRRKGVCVWTFDGVSKALAASGAGWYYTWSTTHDGVSAPAGTQFVPMIWGQNSMSATALAQAKAAGPYLLGFNEPDMDGQANMTVAAALARWPKLMATGKILGSPAVAWGGADVGGWLDRFMTGAKISGYRVDFIALHWYGGDFRTANAVSQLRSYLQAVYNRYHKPIWLTEFALIDFSSGSARFPTQAQQAAFLTAATTMLGQLSYLQRYAWFALPATDKDQTGLFRTATSTTAIGKAFQAAK